MPFSLPRARARPRKTLNTADRDRQQAVVLSDPRWVEVDIDIGRGPVPPAQLPSRPSIPAWMRRAAENVAHNDKDKDTSSGAQDRHANDTVIDNVNEYNSVDVNVNVNVNGHSPSTEEQRQGERQGEGERQGQGDISIDHLVPYLFPASSPRIPARQSHGRSASDSSIRPGRTASENDSQRQRLVTEQHPQQSQ